MGVHRMLEWTKVGLNASLAQQSLEAATTTVGWLVGCKLQSGSTALVRSIVARVTTRQHQTSSNTCALVVKLKHFLH